ncbi:hypothetical protein TWF694_007694 [Orbilia ellipsospora]|uniref:Peptide N-acetyl-beta-D-glucosaminyl asparaginase amidase A N-terminal domain-containing protein n=1 Tax=Orbilia ellipsospora TaxID=2528407 RepID=A0AAV9XIZ6_9PEZI
MLSVSIQKSSRSVESVWRKLILAAAYAIPTLALPALSPSQQQNTVLSTTNDGATDIFQVYRPPLAPIGKTTNPHDDFSGEACSSTLFTHEFVNSWGQPAVAPYTPPPQSCEWNTVYFHLHSTSKGRQYDRLAFLYFNDTELWRTSTAEPTANGIYFTYTKDLTHFEVLLRQNGKLIFDLGNTVTNILTGTFTVTLSAHYFKLDLPPQQKPADIVLPVSKMQGSNGQASPFSLPNDLAETKLSIPQNVKKAVLSVIASGNADEEFWYTNVPDNLVSSFPNTTLFGHSSYREIQVLVDGVLIDVIMPIPTIYTGGINPGLWKPIVCPYAYDLWEAHIDITPWVAGKSSAVIELQVEGMVNSGQGLEIGGGIGSNWYVSGRMFFWTDNGAPQVKPAEYSLQLSPPDINFSHTVDGEGEDKTASFRISVGRKIVITRDFGSGILSWERTQSYGIESALFANGNNQSLWTNTLAHESVQVATYVHSGQSYLHETQMGPSISIRDDDFTLRVNSSGITYPDQSFYIFGKVNSRYTNQGPESPLLTDKSPFFMNLYSEDKLGVNNFHDDRFVDASSAYFSAAPGSGQNSWISGDSHQGYRYNLDGNYFSTDRTVRSYERDVKSTYPNLTGDIQTLNGVSITKFSAPTSTNGRRLMEVEIGPDEVICASRPQGDLRGHSSCPDKLPPKGL